MVERRIKIDSEPWDGNSDLEGEFCDTPINQLQL